MAGIPIPKTLSWFHRRTQPAAPLEDGHDSDDFEYCDEEAEPAEQPGAKRYKASQLLLFLEFASFLRSSSDLRKALVVAAKILDVELGAIDIPCRQTLSRSLVKLDLCMMLWERHSSRNGFACAASLSADSSKQSHWDFIVSAGMS